MYSFDTSHDGRRVNPLVWLAERKPRRSHFIASGGKHVGDDLVGASALLCVASLPFVML